jgi:hypothetical protein
LEEPNHLKESVWFWDMILSVRLKLDAKIANGESSLSDTEKGANAKIRA